MSNILKGFFNEEVTGAGKGVFEGGFKFVAADTRKKFDSTVLTDRGFIW